MEITLTPNSFITAGAVVAAVAALVTYFSKMVRWVDQQKKQDADIQAVKSELTLLTYGVLACLKGLKDQGQDGAVTEAIDKIEKHLNQEAHK